MIHISNFAKHVAQDLVSTLKNTLNVLSQKVQTFELNTVRNHMCRQRTKLPWLVTALVAYYWYQKQVRKNQQYVLKRKMYRDANPLLTKSEVDGDHLISINEIKGKPVLLLTEK